MRFTLTLLSAALFAMLALAKSVIITYPENTPDFVLSQAKDAIVAAVSKTGLLVRHAVANRQVEREDYP